MGDSYQGGIAFTGDSYLTYQQSLMTPVMGDMCIKSFLVRITIFYFAGLHQMLF